MKTLIVATDFSEGATKALEYTAVIAQKIKAKVIIYHAYMLPAHVSQSSLNNPDIQKLIKDKEAHLELLSCQIANYYRIETDWSCSMGNVCFELDAQVEKFSADIVVMGMGGKTFQHKLFGNSTTTLIRHARFPVLVVPGSFDIKIPQRILFACDLNCRFSLQSLKTLNETANSLNAQVQVLHIESIKKEKKAELAGNNGQSLWDEQLTDSDYASKEIESANIIKGIERGIREFGAELLVMVPQRYGFWNSLIHKSKTCEMAAKTNIPLLSIPNYH